MNNIPGRAGILIHWGNKSEDSNGCLLINRIDPSGDTYTSCCKPDNSPKVNNYWTDSIDFMGELIDEINRVEEIIKETYQLKVVQKKIIINENSEINN